MGHGLCVGCPTPVRTSDPEERVLIYTANLGEYDEPHPLLGQEGVPYDALYFSDSPDVPPGWVGSGVTPGGDTLMAAKAYKLTPWDRFEVQNHRWLLWVDAGVLVDNPRFAAEAVAEAGRHQRGVTVFRHPQRRCIYAEGRAYLRRRPDDSAVIEQLAAYRAAGYPRNAGLYAGTCVLWDTEAPDAARLGRAWLEECERWSARDQISLPPVAGRLGIEVATFPHHLFRHTFLGAVRCFLGRSEFLQQLIGPQGARPFTGGASVGAGGTIGNPWFRMLPHASGARGRPSGE